MKLASSLLLVLALAGTACRREGCAGDFRGRWILAGVCRPDKPFLPLPVAPCSRMLPQAKQRLPDGQSQFPELHRVLERSFAIIDPRAMTDIYPIFGTAFVSTSHILPEGDLQLYGAGLTVALSERIAVGLNQGGYAVSSFAGKPHDGWLNLGGFGQYTLIQDVPDQCLVTAGLRSGGPQRGIIGLSRTWPRHLGSLSDSGQGAWRVPCIGNVRLPIPSRLGRFHDQPVLHERSFRPPLLRLALSAPRIQLHLPFEKRGHSRHHSLGVLRFWKFPKRRETFCRWPRDSMPWLCLRNSNSEPPTRQRSPRSVRLAKTDCS